MTRVEIGALGARIVARELMTVSFAGVSHESYKVSVHNLQDAGMRYAMRVGQARLLFTRRDLSHA